jgi:hypothetical protein
MSCYEKQPGHHCSDVSEVEPRSALNLNVGDLCFLWLYEGGMMLTTHPLYCQG